MNPSNEVRPFLDREPGWTYPGDMNTIYPTQVNVYVERSSAVPDLLHVVSTVVRWFLLAMVGWVLFVLAFYVATEHTWAFLVALAPAFFLLTRVRRRMRKRAAQMIAYDRLREAKAQYYREWREEMEHNRV